MNEASLLDIFLKFGTAGLLGFLIGLEREHASSGHEFIGIRDFVIFSLLGAISTFLAQYFENSWLIAVIFAGFSALLVSGYWNDPEQDAGFTTELAAMMTFFVGVIVILDHTELSFALTIAVLIVLSQRQALTGLRSRIKPHEMQAILKFLVITFIILPVLPHQSLDTYATKPIGEIIKTHLNNNNVSVSLDHPEELQKDEVLYVFDLADEYVTSISVNNIFHKKNTIINADIQKNEKQQTMSGFIVKQSMLPDYIRIMLSAIQPYKIWLIVVLVSFISFIGYILIKLLGSSAGIGLTGLVGGLVSSTVTTLSFSKRSKQSPQFNNKFAMAVVLAASIMFPRLLLEITVVNRELMKSMAVPVLVMGGTGMLISVFYFYFSQGEVEQSANVEFSNPFSLKSAISFALIFSCILMVTRLATQYLGSAWLPIVSIISGLTDADAIAFSISDAQQSGKITADWAGFNLVLGALSNTFMKLFLVFSFGDKGLFKRLILAFSIIGGTGVITMIFYYDLLAHLG